MLNNDGDWNDDSATKNIMAEGKTLFMLGSNNTFKAGDIDCEFGLMPYLSEDGTQNALILNVSRYVGLNKHLEDKGNEQKLQDAVHVMEVMSTVEGLNSMSAGFEDNSAQVYTTVTEKLDTDDCTRLVGICFAKASGADLALVSQNKWYPVEEGNNDLNSDLYALPVTDQEITSILPTGWRGNIKTVTLTGKRIQELLDTGYNKSGYVFPYVLVAPAGFSLQADTTYTAVICGVSNEAAQEGNITDTRILGLTAAGEYLSQFETLLKKDIRWEK